MSYTIINKNNIEYLKTQPDNHFDSIVTDPPYGIEFLAKDWDKNTGAIETWQECLRTLKPGGYILAFSAARTYHQLATNIESVGFEIRDQLMWLYASGFPKAQKIKGHEGWKTSLKPAHEPIVMARKPYKGSTYKNMDRYGVGALNIDESRVPYEDQKDFDIYVNNIKGPLERSTAKEGDNIGMHEGKTGFKRQKGKVVLPSGGANGLSRLTFGEGETTNADSFKQYTPNQQGRYPSNVIGEVEGYQKYFYCPKVTRKERHCGFEQTESEEEMLASVGGYKITNEGNNNMCYIPNVGKIYVHGLKHEVEKIRKNKDPLAHIPAPFGDVKGCYKDGERFAAVHQKLQSVGNNHPTVKPVALMRYLIQLVTPPNSRVLDPFCGSGSTGMAAVELGHEFIGCELDANYVDICIRRIEGWNKKDIEFERLFDAVK